MSIYDCISYFDEDLVLDLRFNILNSFVDKFIIVESDIDHAGKKKDLKFNVNNFPNYKNKIYHYIVKDMPIEVNKFKKNWSPNFIRENFQRNAIERCISSCKDDDLIIISDADEIPNLKVLDYIKIKKFALFKQIMFMYKINLVSNWNWLGSGISYYKHLKSPQWLRNKRFLRRGFFNRFFNKTQLIEKGGWHFSYLKNPSEIFKKLNSFAHGEYKNITYNHIKECIENNKNIFQSEKNNFTKLDITLDNYPEYIVNNQSKFNKWIAK